MKKYLLIILAALLSVSIFTGYTRRRNPPKQNSVSDTRIPVTAPGPGKMPDYSFSQDDYQRLLALRLDGYEDMTVSDFQMQVWKLTDTAEYRDLLERFTQSKTLFEWKDTDETASFMFYVLEPLTAEKWQSRDYSGYADSGFSQSKDHAMLEYVFTLTILSPDTLTIRDYNSTRLNIISGMQDIIKSKTREELQDENADSMLAALQTDTDNLIEQLQTEKIGISIDYAYFPLSAQNNNNENKRPQDGGTQEMRSYSNGTEEDYRSLLTLKTADYQKIPLMDFNNALLEWTNENHQSMERISEDTGWNDFQVILNNEELSFVKFTVFLSGMENGKAIQSVFAGQPISPYYDEKLPQRTTEENGIAAWCSLYYQFSYSISDTETITVGERDRQIKGMINAVQTFWNDTDLESMLKMNKNDIVKELEKIAAAHSSSHITITINEKQVHFECMDERKILA